MCVVVIVVVVVVAVVVVVVITGWLFRCSDVLEMIKLKKIG